MMENVCKMHTTVWCPTLHMTFTLRAPSDMKLFLAFRICVMHHQQQKLNTVMVAVDKIEL